MVFAWSESTDIFLYCAKAMDLTFEAQAKGFKMSPQGRPRGQGRARGQGLREGGQ